MLTAEGCRGRRQRLLDRLKPTHPLLLADPLHLRYFANFYVEAFSLGADFGGLLLIQPDGQTTLYHDNRLPKSVEAAHADERVPVKWYDGKSPGDGPRRMILRAVVELSGTGGRIHDGLADPLAPELFDAIAEMRRREGPGRGRAAPGVHAGDRGRPRLGRGERQAGDDRAGRVRRRLPRVLRGGRAGRWWCTATSPSRPARPGAAARRPTQVIKAGETLILDYSVVIQGYRSDFTNTLVVGGRPDAGAAAAVRPVRGGDGGGREAAAGRGRVPGGVRRGPRGVRRRRGWPTTSRTTPGTAWGSATRRRRSSCRHSTETLVAGDVVTLEPGLYVDGVGGVRIEHNYLITQDGLRAAEQPHDRADVTTSPPVATGGLGRSSQRIGA